MKKNLRFTLLSFLLFLGFSSVSWGQGSENFTNLPTNSASSYAARTWTGTDGVTWTANEVRTDQNLNGKAATFNTSGTRNVTSPSYSGGIGVLTFNYSRAFSGTNVRTLQVYVNNQKIGADIVVSPTSDAIATYSETINIPGNVVVQIRSTGAAQVKIDDISWTGFVDLNAPVLDLSNTSLPSFGEVTVGTSSISQNFTVTGENLVENVVVNAPANFEISIDDVNFTNQLTLTPTAGEVSSLIYARFSPVSTGLKNGDITLVSGSLNRTVAVTGTGIFTISLTNNGYFENFSNFVSTETLPLGWTVSNATYAGDWGSGFTAGLRGNANVLGFQHTGSTGTFTTSSTYTNNTGAVITDLLVSYLGKVERIDQLRNPIWTVTVAGNVVAALSYDTAVNQDQLVSSVVSGLNIPVGANFTIEFSSQRGGTTGSSKQIGIGDFNIQSVTVWNGIAWSNGEPTITKSAVIQGDYTTTANLEANTLTVNSGVFTIASGTSVTVEGAVVNNAAATNFIVENNGNLLQNATAANVGAITVRANSQPLMRLDYTLWSSPVAGQNLKAFSPNTLSPRFYVYDETATTGNSSSNNGTYVTVLNETNEATYNFEAAQGYLIRTPNNHPTTPTVYNGVFTGVPQNGDYSATLSTVNAGYNLVGNPYPSSIDLNAFFTGNSAIENTV
ncbi:MAG: hypothetical protein MUF43_09990, partial [Flavobacterium sp.]|nr:hypothetical protein [Flavobacterium sp.]